jgi:Carbohydrate-selective porin, OprB family
VGPIFGEVYPGVIGEFSGKVMHNRSLKGSAVFNALTRALARVCCVFLCCLPADAQTNTATPVANQSISESSEDINAKLNERERAKAVFSRDPLEPVHNAWDAATRKLYEAIGIDLGFDITGLYQNASKVLPGADDHGFVVDYDFFGRWDLVNRGGAWPGSLYFATEQRKPYTDTTPAELRQSIGSVMGTIDGFNDQPFLLTNLFWRQGTKEDGFMYQVGRFSPDGIVNVSQYNNPNTNFHPIGLVGSLTISFPAHGYGAAAVLYPSENTFITALISDANGNKRNSGDIGQHEFFKAAEFGYKPNFGGPFEGRHALTVWHVDEREKRGVPEGHGIALKLEQDVTRGGNVIAMARYSRSFGGASAYVEQASAYLIVKNLLNLESDELGLSAGWADPTNPLFRNEYIAEVFYSLPVTPELDVTASVQVIFNPAANPGDDRAAVGSVRFRKTF